MSAGLEQAKPVEIPGIGPINDVIRRVFQASRKSDLEAAVSIRALIGLSAEWAES
jgi:hypothetical protein